MSFKGRMFSGKAFYYSSPTHDQSGTVTKNNTQIGEIILTVKHSAWGVLTNLSIVYDVLLASALNFDCYEVDTNNNILGPVVFVGGSSGDVSIMLSRAGSKGIAFVNRNFVSNYIIEYEVRQLSFLPTKLIDNPIDLLWHVKLFSNWSELIGIAKIWGQEPENNALIDIASFNSSSLNEVRDLKIARQLIAENEADSLNIADSICNAFYLLSKINPLGYETVSYLFPEESGEYDLITRVEFNSIGKIIPPKPQDLFCQPKMKYGYDQATKSYTKTLSVTNIEALSWQSAYTPGFTDEDGETVWNSCKSVYNVTGIIEPMPDNLINQVWISDYNVAVWKFKKDIEWRNKSRGFINVPWQTGKNWEVGTFIRLKDFITGNAEIRCLIEDISKGKNQNSIDVNLILIDEIEPVILSGTMVQNVIGVHETAKQNIIGENLELEHKQNI